MVAVLSPAGAVREVVSDGGGRVDVPEEMAAPVPAPKPMQADRMEDARSAEMVAIAPIFLKVGRDVVVDSSWMVADVVVCGGRFSIELMVLIIGVVIPEIPALLDVNSAPAIICDDDDDTGVVYGVIAASPSSYIFPPAASANPPERVAGFNIGLASYVSPIPPPLPIKLSISVGSLPSRPIQCNGNHILDPVSRSEPPKNVVPSLPTRSCCCCPPPLSVPPPPFSNKLQSRSNWGDDPARGSCSTPLSLVELYRVGSLHNSW